MTGTIISIPAAGAASPARGMIQPTAGGPPIPFLVADTEDGERDGVKTLTASHVGTSINYIYDGASGYAKKVRFVAGA